VALDHAMKWAISCPQGQGHDGASGEETVNSTQTISGLIETEVLCEISQPCYTSSASCTSWKPLPDAVAKLTLGWLSDLSAPWTATPVPELAQDRGEQHLPSGSRYSLLATLCDAVLNVFW